MKVATMKNCLKTFMMSISLIIIFSNIGIADDILNMLRSKDSRLKAQAIDRMIKFNKYPEGSIPLLISVLDDHTRLLRKITNYDGNKYTVTTQPTSPSKLAARALINKGHESVEELIKAISEVSISKDKMNTLAKCLGDIGDKRALPVLIKLLEGGNIGENLAGRLGGEVPIAIGKIGKEGSYDVLSSAYRKARREKLPTHGIIRGLGHTEDIRSMEILQESIRENNRNLFAVRALGYLGKSEALPILIKALNDKSEFVRANACEAIGDINDPSAIVHLKKLLETEKNSRVIRAAAEAINALQDR
jgi:HEAT repeat protein